MLVGISYHLLQYLHAESCIPAVCNIPLRGLDVETGRYIVQAALDRVSFDVVWQAFLPAPFELQVSD